MAPCVGGWYRKYAPGNTVLEGLETEARAGRKGLWADSHSVPPWEWRKARGMKICRKASPEMKRRGAGYPSLSHRLVSVLPLSSVGEHQVQPDHNEGAQDIRGPFPEGVIDTVDQDRAHERVVD